MFATRQHIEAMNMSVSKDLVCPFCSKSLPIGLDGYAHDKDLNLICIFCSKPLFGVTQEAENRIKSQIVIKPPSYCANKKEPLPIRLSNTVDIQEPHLDVIDCDEQNYMFV